MKTLLIFAASLFFSSIAPPSQQQPPPAHHLAESMQRKLDHIRQNGLLPHPDPAPTIITEEEVSDYIASGRMNLPAGVKQLTMKGNAGVVTALLTVDFDEIRAGKGSSNPLLAMLSGTHTTTVEAGASASNGRGKVHVRSVSVDGTVVPNFVLEIFVQKFITPKYPGIGMDSEFQLTDRIDTATVGWHKLIVTQK